MPAISTRVIIYVIVGLSTLLVVIQLISFATHRPDGSNPLSGVLGLSTASDGNKVCERFESMGLYAQAEEDFAHYKNGLSPEQQAAYRTFCKNVLKHSCMTIIILRGRIFVRHFYPGYQSRHRTTLHALYRVAQRFGPLPDAQFVVEVTDGYLGTTFDLPIFMITRPSNAKVGVLYPDFTFYSWPEAACPPERSHGYGYLYSQFQKEAQKSEAHPEDWWAAKEDTLFWRGGRVHNQIRDRVLSMFRDAIAVDMAFMEWKNTSITGINGAPGCVGLMDHCKYRYLAFLDGNTYSSRLKYNLLCGSCVFASRPKWIEWWTRHFQANVDYVEVQSDWSDGPQRHSQVRWSADGGRKIAESGQKKALKFLNEDAIDCYWLRLIEKASKVLPRPPQIDYEQLPPSTKPIEDVLLYSNDVVIDDDGLIGPVVLVR